jgi:predicted ATPase
MTVKAVEYLFQAGDRAARLFANDEAIAHYRHGIELIETLEDKPQRNQLELALQLALSVPLMATQGFSGDELAQAYGRARDLTRGVEASPKLFHILSGLKSYYDVRGGFQEAKEISEDLLRMAKDMGDPGLIALAHHQLSVILPYLGQLSGFVDHREKMIATYDSERD